MLSQVELLKQKLVQSYEGENGINLSAMPILSETIDQINLLQISSDILEQTRLGRVVNDVRRRVPKQDPLAKKCRNLIKSWQSTLAPQAPPSTSSGGGGGLTPLITPKSQNSQTKSHPVTPANCGILTKPQTNGIEATSSATHLNNLPRSRSSVILENDSKSSPTCSNKSAGGGAGVSEQKRVPPVKIKISLGGATIATINDPGPQNSEKQPGKHSGHQVNGDVQPNPKPPPAKKRKTKTKEPSPPPTPAYNPPPGRPPKQKTTAELVAEMAKSYPEHMAKSLQQSTEKPPEPPQEPVSIVPEELLPPAEVPGQKRRRGRPPKSDSGGGGTVPDDDENWQSLAPTPPTQEHSKHELVIKYLESSFEPDQLSPAMPPVAEEPSPGFDDDHFSPTHPEDHSLPGTSDSRPQDALPGDDPDPPELGPFRASGIGKDWYQMLPPLDHEIAEEPKAEVLGRDRFLTRARDRQVVGMPLLDSGRPDFLEFNFRDRFRYYSNLNWRFNPPPNDLKEPS